MRENEEVLRIVDKYINYFIDGMGGLKLDIMASVLEYEGKPYLMDKLMLYMKEAMKEISKEHKPIKTYTNKKRKSLRGKN